MTELEKKILAILDGDGSDRYAMHEEDCNSVDDGSIHVCRFDKPCDCFKCDCGRLEVVEEIARLIS